MKFQFFFFLFLPMVSFAQTNYYVSISGNDSNSGTSLAQAWQTVQHSMNNATPNSIVNITAGTYNEKVEVNVSGTSGNPITFQNYNNDVVTLSGAGIGGIDAILGIFDHSYIIIQGLNVANNEQLDAQGIIVEGDCQFIEIRNNDISNIHFSSNPNATANATTNSQPLIVYGSNGGAAISNLIIDGNTVRDSRTGYSEGLAVNGNVDGFEVTNNVVHDITNIGIDLIGHEGTAPSNDQARNGLVKYNTVYNCKSPYATAAGIYVDGAKDIVIENNIVFECQWGIEVGCENVGKTSSNMKIRNNVIYRNDDAALTIGGFDFPTGSGKVTDVSFTNNSCYGNDKNNGGIGGASAELVISYVENCTVENNIFYTNNASNLLMYVENVGSLNLNLNYNQYYTTGTPVFDFEGGYYTSFSSYKTGASQDANSIFSDPQFANTVTPDLHLTSMSPALDSGNPAFVPDPTEEDMDGENRLLNSIVDMGADELDQVLAIELVAPFQAIAYADFVQLKWITSPEQNYFTYKVQRSDNLVDWEDKLTIQREANSSASNDFLALDKEPISGLSYYRLKQIQANGVFDYSNVASVQFDSNLAKVEIYPNPVGEQLNLKLYNPFYSKYDLEISTVSGKVVMQRTMHTSELSIDVSDWKEGVYILKITSEFGTINQQKILLQH